MHKTRLNRDYSEYTQKTDRKQTEWKISQEVNTLCGLYIHIGEWTFYAGILGSEEELNNYERWITHGGNTDITRVMQYADRITHKP